MEEGRAEWKESWRKRVGDSWVAAVDGAGARFNGFQRKGRFVVVGVNFFEEIIVGFRGLDSAEVSIDEGVIHVVSIWRENFRKVNLLGAIGG